MPTPGDLPNPGIISMSPASPALAGRLFTTEPPGSPILGELFIKVLVHHTAWNRNLLTITMEAEAQQPKTNRW